MQENNLNRIKALEEKINQNLEECDFLNLPQLSIQLSDEVKKLTESFSSQSTLSPRELDLFEKINKKLKYFENETFEKFKDYTIKTSKQAKMHSAYKKYGA